jgi:hypothetical protein
MCDWKKLRHALERTPDAGSDAAGPQPVLGALSQRMADLDTVAPLAGHALTVRSHFVQMHIPLSRNDTFSSSQNTGGAGI